LKGLPSQNLRDHMSEAESEEGTGFGENKSTGRRVGTAEHGGPLIEK